MVPLLFFSQPIAALSHILGGLVCLVAAPFLIRRAKTKESFFALLLFSTLFILLLLISGVFHSFPHGETREVFRQLDHAFIWLVIAGSFSPPHVLLAKGYWRYPFLGFVWFVALSGLLMKSLYLNQIPGWVGIILYIATALLGVLSIRHMYWDHGWQKVKYCFLGAFFYLSGGALELYGKWTGGVIFVEGWVYNHEVFHFFVLLGALSHWLWMWEITKTPEQQTSTRLVKNGTRPVISDNPASVRP